MLWSTFERLVRNPQGLIGLLLLVLLVSMAVLADVITWHDPNVQDASARFLAPSWEHPFGTDELRRDLYSRTLHGLRTSLIVSLAAVSAGAAAGIALGFIAGYFGKWIDATVMRFVDALLAFPGLLIALAIITMLGPSLRSIGIAVAIFAIPSFCRLSRGQMLSERNKDYVLAAEAMGAGPLRIIFRHIALNAIPPLLTQVALFMTAAVLLHSSLSFLGLGERPPDPSLGGLINNAKSHVQVAWWYAVFPGAVLAALLFSLNLLADAVNDAMSPFDQRR